MYTTKTVRYSPKATVNLHSHLMKASWIKQNSFGNNSLWQCLYNNLESGVRSLTWGGRGTGNAYRIWLKLGALLWWTRWRSSDCITTW